MERRRKIVTLQRWNLANTILNQRVRTNIDRDKSVIVYALDKMWYEWYFISAVFTPHPPNILTQSDHEKTITQILHEAAVVLCLVMSNSLWPHGLMPARLLCPWNSPGKNTGEGCQFLLQRVFWIQGLNPHLLCLLQWQAGSLPLHPLGSFPHERLSTKSLTSNPQSYEVYLKQGVWEVVTTKRRSCDGKRRIGKNWGSHIKNGCHMKRMYQDWFMNCDKYITLLIVEETGYEMCGVYREFLQHLQNNSVKINWSKIRKFI